MSLVAKAFLLGLRPLSCLKSTRTSNLPKIFFKPKLKLPFCLKAPASLKPPTPLKPSLPLISRNSVFLSYRYRLSHNFIQTNNRLLSYHFPMISTKSIAMLNKEIKVFVRAPFNEFASLKIFPYDKNNKQMSARLIRKAILCTQITDRELAVLIKILQKMLNELNELIELNDELIEFVELKELIEFVGALIRKEVLERNKENNPVSREALHHSNFCYSNLRERILYWLVYT